MPLAPHVPAANMPLYFFAMPAMHRRHAACSLRWPSHVALWGGLGRAGGPRFSRQYVERRLLPGQGRSHSTEGDVRSSGRHLGRSLADRFGETNRISGPSSGRRRTTILPRAGRQPAPARCLAEIRATRLPDRAPRASLAPGPAAGDPAGARRRSSSSCRPKTSGPRLQPDECRRPGHLAEPSGTRRLSPDDR